MIVATSSGSTCASRSPTTASPVAAPRARRSASVSAPGTSPSNTITCSSSGQRSRTCVDLGDLRGVLAEDGADARVGEDVLALLGRVGVVDRDDRRAGAQGAEVGERPLRARAGEDRDVVAALDPELGEPAGDLVDRAAELGVGDRLAARAR